jgi:hypothetical protein
MSLFKAREYWSCQVGSGEQFDYGCLKVGSFNEDSNSKSKCFFLLLNIIILYFYLDKIIVGSHSGILRIYNPSSSEPDSVTNNYATDLLLEKNLGMPIVQVEIGKFLR